MRTTLDVAVDSQVMTSLYRGLLAIVRGVAFWTAILLPIVFFALLVAGSPRLTSPTALAKLLGLNVGALVVGHEYRGLIAELTRL